MLLEGSCNGGLARGRETGEPNGGSSLREEVTPLLVGDVSRVESDVGSHCELDSSFRILSVVSVARVPPWPFLLLSPSMFLWLLPGNVVLACRGNPERPFGRSRANHRQYTNSNHWRAKPLFTAANHLRFHLFITALRLPRPPSAQPAGFLTSIAIAASCLPRHSRSAASSKPCPPPDPLAVRTTMSSTGGAGEQPMPTIHGDPILMVSSRLTVAVFPRCHCTL